MDTLIGGHAKACSTANKVYYGQTYVGQFTGHCKSLGVMW